MSIDLDAIEAVEARATRLYPGTADYPLSQVGTDLAALVAEVKRLNRRLGMTRDNAADDLAEMRAENERLLAVAAAARDLIDCDPDTAQLDYLIELEDAVNTWRAGGEG